VASLNSSTVDQHAAAKINIQLGVYYMRRGDIQRAKQKLTLALKQDPNYSPAQSAMGYYLETVGDKQEAQKYYLRAISLAPKSGAAHNNYGTFLCHNKQYQPAIEQFILATKDRDYLNTAGAYENAGLCALKIPDSKLAKKYLNKALRNNPQLPKTLLKLSEISLSEGDNSASQEYLQKFSQLSGPTKQSLKLKKMLNLSS